KGGGDADVITVTTDANEWNYTAPAWLRESGKTATTLTLTASAAPLGSRIGVVTITAGDKSRQVEVIQRGLADIMDLIFNADGTATNIADPELPVITTPYVKTGETDIDRLTTVKSETYGRYIARFAHTDWVSGYLTPTGFYRLEYGTVADKLTNGHSMEALVSSNVLKDNAKALGGHQGGGVALYFGSGASSGKFTYQAHIGPGYRGPIAPSAAVAGTYYHLVGVYNPSTGLSLYINGELVATHSETSTAMVLSSNENNRWLGIGADTGENKGGENGWDGDIAIARVYDALLTPEQVAALYAEINE
ncbi:MAG: LamG domain-containing protein, partial [Bacteroidales bacterium]|nr:LamG domain-containing protein [Bacteroidales bacterium]